MARISARDFRVLPSGVVLIVNRLNGIELFRYLSNSHMTGDSGYLEALRLIELHHALGWLPPRQRILEVGAGVGWQAREMSRMGHSVEAVDLADSAYAAQRVWPIRDYDGVHLPFANGSFDAVFTSNVLEHVANLRDFLIETRRVVRPGGYLIHVVPSASWRFWTIVTYYPDRIRRGAHALRAMLMAENPPASSSHVEHPGKAQLGARASRSLIRVLLPPPHGAHGSALSELNSFRIGNWQRLLVHPDLECVKVWRAGLFYSGSVLFGGRLPFPIRRFLARIFGSSCHILALRKRHDSRDTR